MLFFLHGVLNIVHSQSTNDNRNILRRIAKRAQVLYQDSEHSSLASCSVHGFDPSLDLDSLASSTRFDFDDEIIAWPAYQRALQYLYRREDSRAEVDQQPSGPLSDAQTTVSSTYEDSASNDTARLTDSAEKPSGVSAHSTTTSILRSSGPASPVTAK